jgi:hypothetical protein
VASARGRGKDAASPRRSDLMAERDALLSRLAEIDRLLARPRESAVRPAPERRG